MLIHSFVKRTAGRVALANIRFASWLSGLVALSVCIIGISVQGQRDNSHKRAQCTVVARSHGILLHSSG